MTRSWLILLVTATLLAPGLTRAQEKPDLRRLFPNRAPIQYDGRGLIGLELSPAVLAACRPDLSDLRILDSAGSEIPFLLNGKTGPAVREAIHQRIKPNVLAVERHETRSPSGPPLYRETIEIEMPRVQPEAGAWDLSFTVGKSRFVRRVDVVAKDEDGRWRALVSRASLFRLFAMSAPGREKRHVSLPPNDAKQLRITLEGEDGYLEPTVALISRRPLPERSRATVALEVVNRQTRDGITSVELNRPVGLVPDVIRIQTSTSALNRVVRVWDSGTGSTRRLLGEATVFRLPDQGIEEEMDVSISPPEGDRLRVEIVDQDSPPLDTVEIAAVVRTPLLVFAAPDRSNTPEKPLTLYYGGNRVFRPRYDLATLFPPQRVGLTGRPAEVVAAIRKGTHLGRANLGPVEQNPLFADTPLLGFALRAGARIDKRTFSRTEILTILVNPDGLARAHLSPEVTAASEANLADLRVVDEASRQWPYILERDSDTTLLSATPLEAPRQDGSSHFTFSLPAEPLRIDQLVLQIAAPFFDRPFELRGKVDDREPAVVAEGRLKRGVEIAQLGGAPPPVVIEFPRARISDLALEIQNGDDAPLAIATAQVRVAVPELLITAPPGGYELLVGNPEAEPPQYELAQIADVVRSVRGSRATTGGLYDNPSFSLRARLGHGDGPQQVVLWIVLVVAVLVLGGLTLRLARRSDTA